MKEKEVYNMFNIKSPLGNMFKTYILPAAILIIMCQIVFYIIWTSLIIKISFLLLHLIILVDGVYNNIQDMKAIEKRNEWIRKQIDLIKSEIKKYK